MEKKSNGFTLVELVVVIAIIGILAAILVPALMGYVKDSKFTSANSNAKIIYDAAVVFSQKCETAGKPITKTAIRTDAFTINTKAGGKAMVKDVVTMKDGSKSIAVKDATGIEIQDAINNAMTGEADGTCYIIEFNESGFVSATYWAKTVDDTVVGKYPMEDDNHETTGGIGGLVKNGLSSFGDIE